MSSKPSKKRVRSTKKDKDVKKPVEKKNKKEKKPEKEKQDLDYSSDPTVCGSCGDRTAMDANKHHLILCGGCVHSDNVCQVAGCRTYGNKCKGKFHFTCPDCKVEQSKLNGRQSFTGQCCDCRKAEKDKGVNGIVKMEQQRQQKLADEMSKTEKKKKDVQKPVEKKSKKEQVEKKKSKISLECMHCHKKQNPIADTDFFNEYNIYICDTCRSSDNSGDICEVCGGDSPSDCADLHTDCVKCGIKTSDNWTDEKGWCDACCCTGEGNDKYTKMGYRSPCKAADMGDRSPCKATDEVEKNAQAEKTEFVPCGHKECTAMQQCNACPSEHAHWVVLSKENGDTLHFCDICVDTPADEEKPKSKKAKKPEKAKAEKPTIEEKAQERQQRKEEEARLQKEMKDAMLASIADDMKDARKNMEDAREEYNVAKSAYHDAKYTLDETEKRLEDVEENGTIGPQSSFERQHGVRRDHQLSLYKSMVEDGVYPAQKSAHQHNLVDMFTNSSNIHDAYSNSFKMPKPELLNTRYDILAEPADEDLESYY